MGTKGDSKVEELPSANVKADGKVDVTIPTDDADLKRSVQFCPESTPEKRSVSISEKREDYFSLLRCSHLDWLQHRARSGRADHRGKSTLMLTGCVEPPANDQARCA
jgi:hypothetical protein